MNTLNRTWTVNGERRIVRFEPLARLLDVLRDSLGLVSLKEGCGEGECGACSLLIDGELQLGCLVAAAQVEDGAVLATAEDMERDELGKHLLQAFDHGGAVQCGYCTPGMLVGSHALLSCTPRPTEQQVREALAGNLCRCTGYSKIVAAVTAVASGEPLGKEVP